MKTPAILLLLFAILTSGFVSWRTYATSEKKGNANSILVAAAFFIGAFILIYFLTFMIWILFGGGFSRM